jgi:hypothetical protein
MLTDRLDHKRPVISSIASGDELELEVGELQTARTIVLYITSIKLP